MTTKAYPRSTITLTNLGIGGENSTEGVNRLPSQRRGACGLGGRSDEGVSQGRCRRDSPTMNNTMLAVGCVRACCEINFGTVPPGGTSREGGIVAGALRHTDAKVRVPPILKHPLSRNDAVDLGRAGCPSPPLRGFQSIPTDGTSSPFSAGSVLLPHWSFAYYGAVGHRAYRIRLHGSGSDGAAKSGE